MNELWKRLKTVRVQDDNEPWLELEYTDYSDFSHFVQFINALDNLGQLRQQNQPYFFRGQSDEQWTLKPKLVRLLEGVPVEDALRYEFDSVRCFRGLAHLFSTSPLPAQEDHMEWLSLMQHFSAPTRLLDWTGSFVVALYFAVFEEPTKRGALWLFHAGPLWQWMREKYPNPELLGEDKRRKVFSAYDDYVEFGVKRAQPRMDCYDPNRKSERVTAQRGIFTICEKLFVDHATVIGEALREGASAQQNLPLCKIILSQEAKKFFRQYLNKLNVTAATLFPGTDGLGRTITEMIRVHRETFHGDGGVGDGGVSPSITIPLKNPGVCMRIVIVAYSGVG